MNNENFKSIKNRVIESMRSSDSRVKNFCSDENDSSLKILTEQLTHALHELDPMGTCCRLNFDMENEYVCEAFHIALLLKDGVSLQDAVPRIFDLWFWENCLKERWGEIKLQELIAQLADDMRHSFFPMALHDQQDN